MEQQDFLERVSAEAGLDDAEADKVTRAFLETLATRLGNDESRQLAMELPLEFQDTLAPTDPEFDKLSTAEFVARFADAAGLSQARAAHVAKVLWMIMTQQVSSSEILDLKSQLSSELNVLLDGDPRIDRNS